MNNNTHTINVASESASECVIHLGAGMGISAPLYQQLGYQQLVLTEVSEELVNILKKKFSQNANVTVKQMAVSAQDEFIHFHCYSKSRYSSQLELEPKFLKNSNLQFLEQVSIPATPLAHLITELKLTPSQANTLIVEFNGYEAQFLTSLPREELIIFSKIIVTLQATARYANQTNIIALSSALMAKGFRLTTTEANQYTYEKDEQLLSLLQTKVQQEELIEQLQNERSILLQENSAFQENLQLITKESNEQAHRHQKNIEFAEALQQELAKTKEELLQVTKERNEQELAHKKNKEWAESLKREIEILKKDYAEGERAQSLALKLQAKAQVDLEHLRTQFQQKLLQEQKLIELIQELQIKLQAAANYYHQLQLQHPELGAAENQNNASAIDAEIIGKPIESKRTYKKRKQDRS